MVKVRYSAIIVTHITQKNPFLTSWPSGCLVVKISFVCQHITNPLLRFLLSSHYILFCKNLRLFYLIWFDSVAEMHFFSLRKALRIASVFKGQKKLLLLEILLSLCGGHFSLLFLGLVEKFPLKTGVGELCRLYWVTQTLFLQRYVAVHIALNLANRIPCTHYDKILKSRCTIYRYWWIIQRRC